MKSAAIAALLGALSFAAPAWADHNHGHNDEHAAHAHQAISQERALEIAAAQGVASVREVEIDDGAWKVEGRTAEGREIEVEIDMHTGAVRKREIS